MLGISVQVWAPCSHQQSPNLCNVEICATVWLPGFEEKTFTFSARDVLDGIATVLGPVSDFFDDAINELFEATGITSLIKSLTPPGLELPPLPTLPEVPNFDPLWPDLDHGAFQVVIPSPVRQHRETPHCWGAGERLGRASARAVRRHAPAALGRGPAWCVVAHPAHRPIAPRGRLDCSSTHADTDS